MDIIFFLPVKSMVGRARGEENGKDGKKIKKK